MSRQQPILPKKREPCGLPTAQSSASFWHKDPSSLLKAHRSTRNLPEAADVVIIGSGITGASVAHHLLSEGSHDVEDLNVVLLEAREACWGATGRNGGHCQPILFEHPDDPSIGYFELRNFSTLQHIIHQKNIDCEFVAQPSVRAIYSKRHLDEVELALHTMQETAPTLAGRMGIITNKDILNSYHIPTAMGAVITNIAARMWPYKLVAGILEDLVTSTSLRGTFNLQTLTPVNNIEHDNVTSSTIVQTDRGNIRAKKVILATNAYTSHLLPQFADLIVPCRGQMSALVPFPSVSGANRLTTSMGFLGDGLDDYLIQRPNDTGGHLMFGGGRQHAESMGVTDDSFVDEKTSHYLRGRLVEAFNLPEGGNSSKSAPCDFCKSRNVKCLPAKAKNTPCTNCEAFQVSNCSAAANDWTEMDATHIWTGIMGFSRDDLPWIGAVPDMPGVYISAGYTGHGMPNAWLCGKYVAMMARGRDEDDMVKETGLPQSYKISRERMEKALAEWDDVETRDWAEMERGRWAARPASGYA